MKLSKINDVRIGQIYEDKILNKIYIIESFNDIRYTLSSCFKDKILICKDEYELTNSEIEDSELIGFLGITHKIEDGKLIEIPREIYNIDDVLKINLLQDNIILEEEQVVVGVKFDFLKNYYEINTIYTTNDSIGVNLIKTIHNNIKKIGILGVNYEFINNKLVKEND